ncbi:hypothetical protein BJX61DRAFT_212717 [Aspergillus egyptiacus]|nr:hypothetical protein BJX61DRAFT_212717 [Aspergillus egyptiacus]
MIMWSLHWSNKVLSSVFCLAHQGIGDRPPHAMAVGPIKFLAWRHAFPHPKLFPVLLADIIIIIGFLRSVQLQPCEWATEGRDAGPLRLVRVGGAVTSGA